jgi:hypothetical protein
MQQWITDTRAMALLSSSDAQSPKPVKAAFSVTRPTLPGSPEVNSLNIGWGPAGIPSSPWSPPSPPYTAAHSLWT